VILNEGFDVLRQVLAVKEVAEPNRWKRTAPHYLDGPRIVRRTLLLAAAMTVAI